MIVKSGGIIITKERENDAKGLKGGHSITSEAKFNHWGVQREKGKVQNPWV